MRALVLAAALAGCGGSGWGDADTKSATDSAHAQLMIETMLSGDAGVAAPRVRALERMSFCANASMLFRHAQAVPDSGIQCQAN